ncbi:doublesex- and mab-3-related transcription factor 1-like isoform X2 [Anguilla rostrata]|uniref:doublesex- and mab-3-related transcription factor 1-like isoform X2 n=1 Tax=Anguilla rostrata TaxID=7938 RepID=UPI0030D20110
MSRNSKPNSHLSKANTRKVARNPKCARCRNHGFVVQLKGHAGKCPFSPCDCWKCSLITERTKIMAIQRRMGKNQKDESLSSVSSSLKETQPQAGCSAEIIDVINDPANASVNDSGPPHDSTAGHRPSAIQRTESVIKMPPARRIEADATPHFPGDYIIAAVAQRDVYSSDLMTLPFPIKFYSPYPNSYGCPAIFLNMPPPPGPGPYNDPQISFPSFHPSTVPYPPDPGPPQEYQAPFVNPLSMSAHSLGPQEELTLRHPPYPTLHKHRGQGGGDHAHGS